MPFLTFLLLSLQLLAVPAKAEVARTEYVEAEIVTEHAAFTPGSEQWIALRMETAKHWHVYWKNPGDSGLPTKTAWTLPDAWTISEPYWEIPQRIVLYPLVNYGYEGESLIAFRLRIPANETPGRKEITAKASWLVCKEECIPEKAELKLSVEVVRSPAKRNPWGIAFDKVRADQPQSLPPEFALELTQDSENLVLHITGDTGRFGKKWDFFPYDAQIIKGLELPTAKRSGSSLRLAMAKAEPFAKGVERFRGMLVADGKRAYSVDLEIPGAVSAAASPPLSSGSDVLWLSLVFALLGGLILNLMPCVFPVLGIKAVSLLRFSASKKAETRALGAAYTAGVVVSFWALASLLVALRAAGNSVGWGFQLQSPYFIGGLVLLFTLMSWNLFGVFEFGGRWTGVGSSLAGRDGWSGSFFTGVLAVVVASPCTAPFMGTAMAAVITRPYWEIFLVFTFLGFGLALPFLILSFFPSWHRWMPKPGAWMESFKQFLAFPLFATNLWLLWVLGKQSGPEAVLIALAAVLVLSFGVWLHWRWRSKLFFALAIALSALLVVYAPGHRKTSLAKQVAGQWVSYDREKLAAARAEGRPVFIDFTAAWCISCQVNKKAVLETKDIESFFRENGILPMRADFTNQDEEIAKAMAEYRAVSVPLYVVYPANSAQPKILGTLLTKGAVKRAFLPATGKE